MTVNFGNVSKDYAKYRDPLPAVLFGHLKEKGIDFDGSKVVDLGAGTGIFSRDLCRRGASVIGIEPSQALIEEAAAQGRVEGLNIVYQNANAEDFALPGTYPFFTAVRAWHWFEREAVIRNVRKHLASEGHLIIVNSVFLPESKAVQLTFRVLRDNGIELKPAGSNAEVKERRSGFPVNWFAEWEANSLHVTEEWQHDYLLPYTHEEWCGKIRSVSWLTNAESELKMKITTELLAGLRNHEEMLSIPHRYSVVILRNIGA